MKNIHLENYNALIDTNEKMRFDKFVEMWFRLYAEKHLKSKTVYDYKKLSKHLIETFGQFYISEIKPYHILVFYDELGDASSRLDKKYKATPDVIQKLRDFGTKPYIAEKAGVSIQVVKSIYADKNISADSAKRISVMLNLPMESGFMVVGKETLSSSTIAHYHRLLSSVMSTAVSWELITDNPVKRVRAPKVKSNILYFDEIETAQLINELNKVDLQYQVMMKLFIFTGCRRGEICGLEWGDIDFENHILHIRRNSLYIPGIGIYSDSTKTEASTRRIILTDIIIELLKLYKSDYDERKSKAGSKWENPDRLFTMEYGAPIHPDTISKWFHKFIRTTGLPLITIHGLRHTNATLQIIGGVPLPTVAGRLGHASPSTTSKIYAHSVLSADERAALVIDRMIEKGNEKKTK